MAKNTTRRRLVGSRAKKRGLPPGSAVRVGDEYGADERVVVFDYDAGNLTESRIDDISDCFGFKDKPTVTWINVIGAVQVEALEALAEQFGLHSLVLEDALGAHQRPKYEDYGDYIQIVLKMCNWDESAGETVLQQVSLVVGRGFVISFQERTGDVFEAIRERLRSGAGRIRRMGPDYLAYCLLDAVVDGYFAMLERRGDLIEGLEDEIVSRPKPETLRRLHNVRRDGVLFRRAIWPLREVVVELRRDESPLMTDQMKPYLADLYGHTIQVIETMETLRDVLAAMLETYLSVLNNRMNEVMKMLTVIATIFIPLTFIVGLYGMNFKHMPELYWPWAYPAVLAGMATIVVGMVLYFKRKKWL